MGGAGIWAAVAGLLAAGSGIAFPNDPAFLNQPISVRQAGMGNVSAAAGDPLRAWSNPAMLATQPTRGALGMSGAALFGGGETAWGMGLGYLVRPGLALGFLTSSISVRMDEVNATGDPTGVNLDRFGAALGPLVAVQWGWLGLGATAKYVFVSQATYGDYDPGLCGDVGATVRLGPSRIVAAARNIGLAGLPEYRAGAACTLERIGLTIGVEYVQPEARRSQPGLGAEWCAAQVLALRAGLADLNEVTQSLTLGLSAVYRSIGVDYAFGMHSLGMNHRVSLSWSFGSPTAELAMHASATAP